MVRIRMSRMGRRHRPFFRINAMEKRAPRDGVVLEALGWYDPLATDENKKLSLKADRIKAWLEKGAQPSQSVGDILVRQGIMDGEAWNAKRDRDIAPKLKRIAKERIVKEAEAAEAKVASDAKAAEDAKAAAEKAAEEAKAAAEKAAAESKAAEEAKTSESEAKTDDGGGES